MKPGRTLFSCAAHQEAKAAISCDDGRPAGWTEALALAFVAEGFAGFFARPELFAELFTQGDWTEIRKTYPAFDDFVASRS